MTTEWREVSYSQQVEHDADNLVEDFHISRTTALILAARGINDKEKYRKFIHPSLSDLHNPFLMKDMDKAVRRLNNAIGQCEKIMIYGDYDVDGTTSVALVYQFLRETVYTEKYLDIYIPDRYDDGYGVTKRGIDIAKEWGAKLIIVLDCGIKAVDEIRYAKSLGIDFIVCDHHTPGEDLPEAVAILNPKRMDNTYPFEHLSGCGVGFKLLQAFSIDNNIPNKYLYKHLELLALSIAADIVPVIGENRVLAYHGLRQLNKKPSLGVKGILKISSLEGRPIDMQTIVFKIGPRINASGRMMNGRKTVELLISKDMKTVKMISAEIDGYNRQRREQDSIVTREAIEMIENNPKICERNIIVISSDKWHKGVIGIVASRISEKYNKPTIVLSLDNGVLSGSARSTTGFDLYKAIESCQHMLINFGGHQYAAGLTIENSRLDEFTDMIQEYSKDEYDHKDSLNNIVYIDGELKVQDITPKLISEIKTLAPFGAYNEKPIFITKDIVDNGYTKVIGKNHNHLRLSLTSSKYVRPIYAIAFNKLDKMVDILAKKTYSIIYRFQDDIFRNNRGVYLNVEDIVINDDK